jgi:hypothetical protein
MSDTTLTQETTETQHTPTPWAIPGANVFRVIAPHDPRKDRYGYWRIVADFIPEAYADEEGIGPEAAANARLVVRAVNSHAELLDALKHLLSRVAELGAAGHAVPLWNALCIEYAMEKARNAIAAATAK